MNAIWIVLIVLIVILILVGITRSNWARQATATVSRALFGREVATCDSACQAVWTASGGNHEICESNYCKHVFTFNEMANSRFEPADQCFPSCTFGGTYTSCTFGEHLANEIQKAADGGAPHADLAAACAYLADDSNWDDLSSTYGVTNCGTVNSCTAVSTYCTSPPAPPVECAVDELGECNSETLYGLIVTDCPMAGPTGGINPGDCNDACKYLYSDLGRHGGDIFEDCKDDVGHAYWCAGQTGTDAEMDVFYDRCNNCEFDLWHNCETVNEMLGAIDDEGCNPE